MPVPSAARRQRYRPLRTRIRRALDASQSADTVLQYSTVGVFAALLVEWKLAERDRQRVPREAAQAS
jgi:hypothetical protein